MVWELIKRVVYLAQRLENENSKEMLSLEILENMERYPLPKNCPAGAAQKVVYSNKISDLYDRIFVADKDRQKKILNLQTSH